MFNGNKLIPGITLLLFCFVSSFAEGQDSLKKEIYSKLKCCACKDIFEICVCPEAKEMKAYIEALLDAGVKKEEIYYKVAKKFTLNTISDKSESETIKKRLISEAGEKRPQLVLEFPSINLGNIKKNKGIIKKAVKIFNSGNQDLIISNIRVSCDCIKSSLTNRGDRSPDFGVGGSSASWSAIISPHKGAVLNVKVDSNHFSIVEGKLFREVYILSNDPLYPQTNLKVEANVTK